MTLQEFNVEFDILYNNITSNSAPPLNEYEKSVFLTQAQLEIVKELYSGRNQLGLAIEVNEESRQYLNSLVTTLSELPQLVSNKDFGKYSKYTLSTIFSKKKYIAILREWIEIKNNEDVYKEIPVVTSTQDSIVSTLRNPFRGISKKRAIKIEEGGKEYIYYSIPESTTYTFNRTYLKMPTPIILEGITDSSLTIEDQEVDEYGIECRLPQSLHRDILMRAVQLAKQTYVGQ